MNSISQPISVYWILSPFGATSACMSCRPPWLEPTLSVLTTLITDFTIRNVRLRPSWLVRASCSNIGPPISFRSPEPGVSKPPQYVIQASQGVQWCPEPSWHLFWRVWSSTPWYPRGLFFLFLASPWYSSSDKRCHHLHSFIVSRTLNTKSR